MRHSSSQFCEMLRGHKPCQPSRESGIIAGVFTPPGDSRLLRAPFTDGVSRSNDARTKTKIHGYDSRVEGLMQKKAPVEKPTYAIGDRVEKLCAVCNEERGHVVASITKRGSISRVTCPKCGTKSSFSSGTKLTGSRSKSVQSEPYDMARTYRTGQVMIHPLWGPGEVTAIIEPRKIDVLFADRIRRLIHSRADL